MGQPIAVMGDQITGVCPIHQIPNPASGVPQPAPPMPFSAPVTLGCDASVLVGGRAVVVVGASGMNTPPHVGLHATDPYMAPPMQVGRVVASTATVLVGGRPVATTTATVTCCATPGQLQATGTTVLVG